MAERIMSMIANLSDKWLVAALCLIFYVIGIITGASLGVMGFAWYLAEQIK